MDIEKYSAGLDDVVTDIEQVEVPLSIAAAPDPLAGHLWLASAVVHRLSDYAMKNETDYSVLRALATRLGHRVKAHL
jgi:hypothetical protein